MKVLLSTVDFGQGGVSKAFIEITKILEQEKIDYDILVEKMDGPYLTEVNEEKVKIIKYDNDRIAELMKEAYKRRSDTKNILNCCLFLLRRIIRKVFKFDLLFYLANRHAFPVNGEYDYVIEFHGYGAFSTYYIAHNFINTTKFTWVHDEKMLHFKYLIKELKEYDKICCVSKACAENLRKEIPEVNRIQVVHNIINQKNIIDRANEYQINEERKILLSIGRLEQQKGFEIIPEIARKMVDRNIQFIWYIIGDGTQREELQNKIEQYGVEDSVVLLGFMSNPLPYLIKCYLYIQPSLHEGYPTTISEALVLNRVIIGTNIPSIREATQGVNKELLLDRNVNSFFWTIKELISNPEKYEVCLNRVRTCEIDNYSTDFLNLLRG